MCKRIYVSSKILCKRRFRSILSPKEVTIMNIIQPSYEILSAPTGNESILAIERAARTCYKSEDKITSGSAEALVKRLIESKHHAMIEFGGRICVKFTSNRGFCYDDQTEVLTYDGWKLFKDTTNEDLFLTLNLSTQEAEYQARIDTTVEDWDDELIYGQSTMVDFAVTPNHRMVWFHYDSRTDRKWRIDQAKEVYGKRVKFKRGLFKEIPSEILNQNSPYYHLYPQIDTEAFARFMGLFITDGSLWKGDDTGGQVTIYQKKTEGRTYVKEVLDELGWNYKERSDGFRINDTKLYKVLRKFFPAEEKKTYVGRIPSFVRHSSRKYIQAFLEAAIVGDGNIHKENGHKVIYTASHGMAGDFQELFMKAGLCASIRVDDRVGQKREISPGVEIENKVPLYVVSVTERTDEHLFNRKCWSKKHYTGKVYCVTVPNGTLYVRRNGKAFWSGNTHEMVRHRLASFAQESTRYCNYSKGKFGEEVTFVSPLRFLSPSESQQIQNAWLAAEKEYLSLIKNLVPAQIAREVLPIGVKAEIVVDANVREWRHIFDQRCTRKAHPRMRELMIPLLLELNKRIDIIFSDIAEKYIKEK